MVGNFCFIVNVYKKAKTLKIFIIAVIIALLPLSLIAQVPGSEQEYIPAKGSKGKDVIWWPTPDLLVKAMLDMANVVPGDTLIDLGSGDGRIVIDAAKQGAYGIGIEYDRELVELSVLKAAEEGVAERAVFINTDLFEFDLSAGTVISLYLLPELNLRLRPRLLTLKPGTRIISNTFGMDNWEPDDEINIDHIEEEIHLNSQTSHYRSWNAFLWIVPANVAGLWITEEGALHFQQQFQQITGTFKTDTQSIEIQAGKLRGNEISFEMDNKLYTGIVSDHEISGTITSDNKTRKWSAIKSSVKN